MDKQSFVKVCKSIVQTLPITVLNDRFFAAAVAGYDARLSELIETRCAANEAIVNHIKERMK